MALAMALTGAIATARAADADPQTLPLEPSPQTVTLQLTPRVDAAGSRIEMQLRFAAGGRHATPITLPSEWASGRGFEQGVRNLRVTSAGGRLVAGEVPQQRRVLHPPRGDVLLAWDLVPYAGASGVRFDDRRFYQPLLKSDYAFFFGHAAWVLPAWHPQQAITAQIRLRALPAGWTAASSFGVLPSGARQGAWRVADARPDTLRHAVYAFGDFRLHRADIAGQPLWIAVRGRFGFADEVFVSRTAALVRAQREFFRDHDFPQFLITLMPNDLERGSVGGTGLVNAFAMHASADFAVPGPDYEFLIAHEGLHTWLPGRFGRMNSSDGAGDEALRYWFSEGFTNFLTHRLLLASGQWTLAQYAQTLNKLLRDYALSPARTLGNAVVRERFFTDRAVGALPYQRGELLALRWDAQLAARGTSLAAVLRPLLLPAGPQPVRPPLATERLFAALEPLLGPGPRADVQALVEQAAPLADDPALLGPCFAMQSTRFTRWELGFDETRSFRERQVAGLVAGSAAQRAGLRDGDLLRGFSVHYGDVDRDVELTVERDGALIDVRYRPVGADAVAGVRYLPRDGAETDPACRDWIALR